MCINRALTLARITILFALASLMFAGVYYLLDHLRQMSFSLNDAIAAVKTSDAFIDREKFEHFWGITPDDKKGGAQRERDRKNEDTTVPVNVSKGR